MSSTLPTLLIILLPFLKLNYVFNIFAIVSIFFVRQYFVLKPIFTKSKSGEDEDLLVLESQPLSPYVEKVRWCLDYGGFKYKEEMVTHDTINITLISIFMWFTV